MRCLSTKEGSFFDSIYPRNTNVSGSKFTKCVTRLDTRIILQFIWGRDRQRNAQHLTATDATVSELTEKIQGRVFNRTAEISLF